MTKSSEINENRNSGCFPAHFCKIFIPPFEKTLKKLEGDNN